VIIMEKLTPRQKEVLEAIETSLGEEGYIPTVRELCAKLRVRSTCTVQKHLVALEEKGFLIRRSRKSRGVQLAFGRGFRRQRGPIVDVPIVGKVAAGKPIYAEENVEEFLPMTRALVGEEDVFLVRIKGDSMTGNGIYDNDLVLVRKQADAENGEVVVAMLDGEVTVKRFHRQDGKIRLESSNPAYEPIIRMGVEVLGKVLLCLHRL
jgi:repressor LexA